MGERKIQESTDDWITLAILKRILANKWFIAVVLVGLFKPSGIDGLEEFIGGFWTYVSKGLSLAQYMAVVVVFAIGIKTIRQISNLFMSIALFQCLYLVSDLINGISIRSELSHVVITIALCMFVELYHKNDLLPDMIKVACIILEVLIVLNVISVFLYPDGIYVDNIRRSANYFLGYKNRHIYYYLPFIALRSYSDLLNKNRISNHSLVMYLVMLISCFVTKSSTSMAIMVIVVLLIAFLREFNWNKFNPFLVTVFSGFVTLILVVFSNTSFIGNIVFKLFEKNASFSSRTTIWNAAIYLFSQRPIIGNGSTSQLARLTWVDIVQAHNKFLDILYVGGIVMMAVFMMMILVLTKKVTSTKSNIQRNVFLFVFVGYGILFLMESAKADVMMYYFFMVGYFADSLSLPNVERHKMRIRLRN